MSNTIDSSYKQADAVLKSKGRSFYWARFFLSKKHASRATRLYQLCRYVDDLADESASTLLAKQSLEALKKSLITGQSSNAVVLDGLALLKECQIDSAVFLDLITGVQSDLDKVEIANIDSLLRYCYQVAGTVGLMMSKVLDTHNPEAQAHAIDLGIAMQLTNICRDVAADATMNRRYLPASLVGDVPPHLLIRPEASIKTNAIKCLFTLLSLSQQYYTSGEQGLFFLPLRARISMWVASRVYGDIGTKLRQQHGDYWTRRIIVSPVRKSSITLVLCSTIPFRSFLWLKPKHHDSRLHHAFADFLNQPLKHPSN